MKNALSREDYTDRDESADGKSKGLPEAVAHKIAVVPLATPLLAGPGSIATVMILNDEPSGITTTIAAIAVNAILAWLILRSSNKLARVLSPSVLMILNTVMNILIAAIGVAFVLKGATAAFSIGIK
ncbi:MAG: MarC family protein [Candidatus Bathyarchaeia archaeon]